MSLDESNKIEIIAVDDEKGSTYFFFLEEERKRDEISAATLKLLTKIKNAKGYAENKGVIKKYGKIVIK